MDDVDRVLAAEALAQDVADARRLDDGADRAARDNAGSRRCGTDHDLAGAKRRIDAMRNGGAAEGHADQVLLGLLHALADGLGDLASFAEPGANDAVAV